MIQVSHLNKYFHKGHSNENHVLKDIQLSFASKGLVCILGESGSGKTTLLNTIGGLDTFASGEIIYDTKKITKYVPKQVEKIRNEMFGYIFQNYYLLQDYTVAYNVKLALNTFALSEEEKEERVDYVLEKLDMAKYKKKLVSQLSGGQQQRVSIARALVKSPKIILADEPTGNLDEENTLRTMSILKNIAKECLVILVSHEKRIAHFFADRIIEIQDGEIVRDVINENTDAYERMDDGNIYLKDMVQTELKQRDTSFTIYRDVPKDGQDRLPIHLNLAFKNGKLYLQNLEDYDLLLEGEEIGCEMLDEHKPSMEMDTVENFDFELPVLETQQSAKLTPREIFKLSLENIRLMGKKHAFIIGILLVVSVFLTISMANYVNGFYFNKRSVIHDDSHYVNVGVEPAYDILEEDYDKAFTKFFEKNFQSGDMSDLFKSTENTLALSYHGYPQLTGVSIDFKNFSYVSLSHLKKKDLVYGRLPEKRDEIVVDQWLFDAFMDKENALQQIFTSSKDLLSAEFFSNVTKDNLKVVGVADTGEPSIYIDQYAVMGMAINGYRIATVDQLKVAYPEKYKDLVLGEDEVLVKESEYPGYQRRGTKFLYIDHDNKMSCKIAGSFPDDLSVDYVLSDKNCKALLKLYILATKRFQVYTDQPEEVVQKIYDKAAAYDDQLSVTAVSPYQSQLNKYTKQEEKTISGRNLIAIAAVIVSLFMIYFMIKSNVSSRSEELTVYRLIGIEKSSIIQSYLLEMFFITSYTVLPAVLLTSSVIKFIGSIPSLKMGLTFPWWTVALLILMMYLLNLLISIMPVRNILSKPPAVLAASR